MTHQKSTSWKVLETALSHLKSGAPGLQLSWLAPAIQSKPSTWSAGDFKKKAGDLGEL